MTTGPLGVLQLGNRPMMFKGCLNTPETFGFPILCQTVPGAWVHNVVRGDPSITTAWIETAAALVNRGAAAITSNCGFALRYQQQVAAAVRVPVMLSSLMLMPALLSTLAPGNKLGVVTFDATAFSPDLLDLAAVRRDAPLSVIGIEGTDSHTEMCRPDNNIDLETLARDVSARIQSAHAQHDLGALLFECAGFGCISQRVRELTGLPVTDAVDAALQAMAMSRVAEFR